VERQHILVQGAAHFMVARRWKERERERERLEFHNPL
jgi:hypothetical protein